MKRTVLVTGATGALGPTVVDEFLNAGYRVIAHSRSPHSAAFAGDVEMRTGDLTDAAAAHAAVQGANVVVHLAALLHIVDPSPALQKEYESINIDATRNITIAARSHDVERIVFFSTIAVYGYNRNETLDENSSTEPVTMYGRTKLEAERVVLSAKSPDGRPIGTVLRLGAVYGSRVQGNYRRLVHAIARGRFVMVGRGENRRSLVYDRDVARAAVVAAEHPGSPGRIFNVTDGQIHTVRDVVGAISSALGRRPPRLRLPLTAVRIAVRTIEATSRIARFRAPVTMATLDKYTEDVAVSSDRIRSELGFTAKYDLSGGWAAAVSEMRVSGEIV